MHKVKPETLKSILSLVRNTDKRSSAVDNASSCRDIAGEKSQQCVTSHGRDTGSDDATGDVIGEGSSPVVDAEAESRRSATDMCDATQDDQLRLATEGESCTMSKVKKVKADTALHGNPISELRDVTCHMGSHSVTCHPTQVNAPHLTPAMQVGTRFTYPGGMEG